MIHTVKLEWETCGYDNILNEQDADFYLFGEGAKGLKGLIYDYFKGHL